MLNPSPFAQDDESIRLADYLFLNEVEATALTGLGIASAEAAADAAQRLSAKLSAAVVITLGEHGALLSLGGQIHHAQGRPANVVDTQGAGDTFLGIFAASLMSGLAPERALYRANIASSFSVEHHGSAQASFPGMQRVDAEYERLYNTKSED
jgi:ribokinase